MSELEDKIEPGARKSPEPDLPTNPHLGTPAPSQPASALHLSDHALRDIAQRFDLLNELGRGGMGIVFRAHDRETSEIVALKILKPEIASSPGLIERFKTELRLARKITHKNVCRSYDLHRFGDTVVIAMEYVEGESLRAMLNRSGGVSLRGGMNWARQVCAALTEAHAQGIVHRDLKPENIVIDRAGQAKVMDFGIARSVDTTTITGVITGTPAYMSPEQAEGKPADQRSDIYALGLVLYELFTGHAAFEAETPLAMLNKHLTEPAHPPREHDPFLPEHIEHAILRCLEKSPERRFQSVDELEHALLQTSAPKQRTTELDVSCVAVQMPARLTRWQRSDWALLAAGVVCLAAFLALFDRAFVAYTALAVPFSRAEAIDRTRALVDKFAPEYKGLNYEASYYGFGHSLAGSIGPQLAARYARERGPSWSVNGERKVQVFFNFSGAVSRFILLSDLSLPDKAPVPVEAVRTDAARYAEEILGLKLANAIPVNYHFEAPIHRWVTSDFHSAFSEVDGTPVVWDLPDVLWAHQVAVVQIRGGRLRRASIELIPTKTQAVGPQWWFDKVLGLTWLATGVFALLVLGFFFVKGLYRKTTVPVLCAAIIAGIGAADFGFAAETEFSGGVQVFAVLLTFVIVLLISYMVCSVCYYYAERALPAHVRSTGELFHPRVPSPFCGLNFLRGVFLGAVYLLAHTAFLLFAGRWNIGLRTAAMEALPFIYPRGGPGPLWPFLLVLLPAIIATLLLIALPAALASRSGAGRRACIAVAAVVFALSGAAPLFGNAVASMWASYLLFFLQGVLFAFVLLEYDLLACFAAVLTVETGLCAYPFARIFWADTITYSAGLIYWSLLVAAAALILAWPRVVALFRRAQAITE
jgi:hypothetical protein